MKAETTTMPNVTQAVPFFAVSSIEASIRYYVDGLGFEMTRNWIDEGKLRWGAEFTPELREAEARMGAQMAEDAKR